MGKIKLKDLKEVDSVYCSSLEENLAFRKVLVKEGFTWDSRRSYNDDPYNNYENATSISYHVKVGRCDTSSRRCYNIKGTIYEASQFLNKNNLYELWD